MESVELHGFKEFYDRLMTADEKKIKPALRTSMRAAAKVVLSEARKRTPIAKDLHAAALASGKRPGDLKRSLKVRALRSKKGSVGVSVLTGESESMFKGKTYYGGFVHYGTKRQEAYPWIRYAFDATKDKMLSAIRTALIKACIKLGV